MKRRGQNAEEKYVSDDLHAEEKLGRPEPIFRIYPEQKLPPPHTFRVQNRPFSGASSRKGDAVGLARIF